MRMYSLRARPETLNRMRERRRSARPSHLPGRLLYSPNSICPMESANARLASFANDLSAYTFTPTFPATTLYERFVSVLRLCGRYSLDFGSSYRRHPHLCTRVPRRFATACKCSHGGVKGRLALASGLSRSSDPPADGAGRVEGYIKDGVLCETHATLDNAGVAL
ncbi:hypothetical protein PENSPDRAFT_15876 [Peniophora sp. CONT]|nr:hypothetical protein PENSPDRAFT_15876 [Peniophora sp. CONT]